MSNEAKNDYDSPWKDIIELWFQDFMEFFFPDVASRIDWQRDYEFLDKEFQQIIREAEQGRKLADKLVRVWLQDGREVWILVHVEVQGSREAIFPKRMYIYNYRIFDRFDRPVVSLALLTDSQRKWRPDSFTMEMLGCQTSFRFLTFKLLDCDEQELKTSNNPFALCSLAQLKANETVNSPETRKKWKVRLARSLYEKGFTKQEIINLFRFIDWIMALPEELAENFWQEHSTYEESKKMEYITSVERIGMRKGRIEGRQEGRREGVMAGESTVINRLLESKFGKLPNKYIVRLQSADEKSLLKWADKIMTAESLHEVFS